MYNSEAAYDSETVYDPDRPLHARSQLSSFACARKCIEKESNLSVQSLSQAHLLFLDDGN